MSRRRWGFVLALTVLVVVAAVVAGLGLSSSRASRPADHTSAACLRVAEGHREALRAPVTAGAPGLIVVIGDSYSQGAGLPTGRAGAFPALVARETGRPVFLDGFGSTGFTTRGLCPDRAVEYGDRLVTDRLLEQRPATVIIEGGVNDARHGDPAGIEAAATALLGRLAGVPQVIVVGPANIPNADPGRLAVVNAALERATGAAGREYLDLLGQPLPMQRDGIHPTAEGQATIARLLAGMLARSPHASIA